MHTSVIVFSYTFADQHGTMKAKETLTAPVQPRSSYRSYYNAYYRSYGDHVDNEKEADANTTENDDGFVCITEDGDKTPSGVFTTDTVDTLNFEGNIFVLTGFGADEEHRLTGLITGKGGEIKTSVVLKTNYLIVNEEYDHVTTKYKRRWS